MFSMIPRASIIVWLRDYKRAKALDQHGLVHYVSKKMRYAVLYVHADKVDEVMQKVNKLPYVKSTEKSHRHLIRTDYSTGYQDETPAEKKV